MKKLHIDPAEEIAESNRLAEENLSDAKKIAEENLSAAQGETKFFEKPPEECILCNGRGEEKDQYKTRLFGSSYWTYKKCRTCVGSGDNLLLCFECEELLGKRGFDLLCLNEVCGRFGMHAILCKKKK